MRGFLLDSEIIEERTNMAIGKLESVKYNLMMAHREILKAVEEIRKHDELSNISYNSLENEIKEIDEWIHKYKLFSMIVNEYDNDVDEKFYKEQEAILEGLSNFRVEDIRVDNIAGITESKSTHMGQVTGIYSTEVPKMEIGFEDILAYGTVSEVMQEQYLTYKEFAKLNGEEYTGDIKQYIKEIVTAGKFDYEIGWKRGLSLCIDVIPVVGDAKGLVEALVGRDLITGRELSGLERAISLVSIVPFYGDGLKIGSKVLKADFKGAGKIFTKEMAVNTASMTVNLGLQEMGVDPMIALIIYQGGRMGHSKGKAFIDRVGKLEDIKLKETEFFNIFSSKKANINEYLKSIKESDGKYVVTFKDKVGEIKNIILRKEELTPYQRYVCFNGCFTKDTLIKTEEGYKKIEEVKDGEKVLSKDVDNNNIGYKKCKLIEKLTSELVIIEFKETVIKTTKDHLFMTDKGWVKAEDLKVNENLLIVEDKYDKIVNISIEALEKEIPIYNLEVEDYHTFYVGCQGILVHNEYKMPNVEKVYKEYIEGINDSELKSKFTEEIKRIKESNDIKVFEEFDRKLQNVSSSDALALGKVLRDIEGTKGVAQPTGRMNMAGKTHPVSGVKFDNNGFPIFESKYDMNLEPSDYTKSRTTHFRRASKDLYNSIQNDSQLASQFTTEEINLFKAGKVPENYTWHHHQDTGRMQLVDSNLHSKTGHDGGFSIWGPGNK